jgi:N utilization substance protein A
MRPDIIEALQQLERGKRMSHAAVKEILETALVTAARKVLGVTPERVEATYDEATGGMTVFIKKLVVEGKAATPDEISLAEAKRTDPAAEVGGEVRLQMATAELGRIAAQTAKHIVLQRVRETERESLFGEFKDKIGKAVTSLVKQRRGKLVILDLGDVEAVLPGNEQIPKEDYRPGEHLKVVVAEVTNTSRGPHIIASRNRPELVKHLFEQEVPELAQGVVEIKAVAREPGSRSKVAVVSHDRNVDPVGACIGMKGMRVQAVVQELHGEKMDVVLHDEDPEAFLINALSPARPSRVVKDDEKKTMIAVAADHNQLVHLIGRGGQNARLASKLTGWKVEIMTESELHGGQATAAAEGTASAEQAPAEPATAEAAATEQAPAEAAPADQAPAEAAAETPAEQATPATSEPSDGGKKE